MQTTFLDVFLHAYPISNAMFVVNGRTLSVRLVGTIKLFPATKITAIVSPIALPIPNTIAVIIPDLAAGTTTLKIVPISEDPKC